MCLLTFMELDEINELTSDIHDAKKINDAKARVAFEITKMVHGEDEAIKAEEAAKALFGGAGNTDNMPTVTLDNPNMSILDAIIFTEIAPSKSQARTLISQNGISLNDNIVTDVNYILSDEDFKEGYAILKKGKKVFFKLVK